MWLTAYFQFRNIIACKTMCRFKVWTKMLISLAQPFKEMKCLKQIKSSKIPSTSCQIFQVIVKSNSCSVISNHEYILVNHTIILNQDILTNSSYMKLSAIFLPVQRNWSSISKNWTPSYRTKMWRYCKICLDSLLKGSDLLRG